MMTGLYNSPSRTGRKVGCAGGGGPTRGSGASVSPAPDHGPEEEEEEGEEEILRFRATVSTAAWGEEVTGTSRERKEGFSDERRRLLGSRRWVDWAARAR